MENDSEVKIEAEQLLILKKDPNVSKQALERAFELAFPTPDGQEWRTLLLKLFYSIGGALFVCGLFFFVDHHWESMDYLMRCSFFGASTALCAAIAWRRGSKSISGKVAISCSSVLLGGFLMVVSNVQDTGSWDLILALWSTLIIPGCIIAEFAPLWLFATSLFNLTLFVVCADNLGSWFFEQHYFEITLLILNASLLASWEIGFRSGRRWTGRRWFPPILTIYGLTPLTLAVAGLVANGHFTRLLFPAGLALVLAWSGFLSYFSAIRRDVSVLALSLSSAVFVGTSFLWLMLKDRTEPEVLLFLAFGIVAQVSGALGLLRKLAPPLTVTKEPNRDRSVAIKRWLGRLATEELIKTDQLEGLSKTIQLQQENALPWFVRLLAAKASFVAAFILFIYCLSSGWVTEENGIYCGLCLCVLACVAARVKSDLLLQGALSLSFCGQLLVLLFLFLNKYDVDTVLLIMSGLQVALVIFFPGSFGRFISANLAGICFAAWIVTQDLPFAYEAFTLIIASAATFIWLKQKELLVGPLGPLHAPLGLASVSLLFGLLWSTLSQPGSGAAPDLMEAVGLTLITFIAAKQLGAPKRALSGLLIVGVISHSAPGVIAATLVLLLSFFRRNQTLQGFAVIFLLLFGSSYYYQLNIELLTKSIVLMSTGAIFALTARAMDVPEVHESGE